jgi:hypothetical protein
MSEFFSVMRDVAFMVSTKFLLNDAPAGGNHTWFQAQATDNLLHQGIVPLLGD